MAQAVYPDSIITEYHDGSAWVDISAYVVGDIKGNGGLGGWRPENRVAVLGILNITINNKGKQFSPMGGDALRGLATLTGWNKGAKIRVRGIYKSLNEEIWTGRIASIDSDDLNWGNEQVRVMAVDYMNVPTNYPMKGATIGLNKRIDEAMTTILSRLSLQPEATNFDTGVFTFPAVFDNVQRKTMALSEFTKLANSELGYIYVKQDGTLRVENMLARHGWRALDQVTVNTGEYILAEDNSFILAEDGTKILADDSALEDASISTDAEGYNILLAEDGLLNASIIRAHPVITDTSLKVLYKLGTPAYVTPKVPYVFSAHYTDPNGLSQVSGTNMQTPVATTDYLANTAADGSGTDKTADIVVTATYYGDTVHYSIANNSTVGVYITFLQARGYGIYYGNSIESTKENAFSQLAYGYAPFQFDMKYQKNTYLADMYGESVINEYRVPKSRTTKMKYLANLNKNHMVSFLMLTIGSLILITEDRSNISNHYYITDRAFTIKQGGIIHVEYGVKQNDSYLSGQLNPVTVEFAGGSASDTIGYGVLKQVNSLTTQSYSFWLYLDSIPGAGDYDLIYQRYSYPGAFSISLNDSKLRFAHNFSSAAGVWVSNSNPFSTGAWVHVVFTYDNSSTANDPIFYVNGSPITITETQTPSGTASLPDEAKLFLGNSPNVSTGLNDIALDGKMFDPRVYNRVLSAAEVTTLYNSGNPDHTLVTDGLVFQGFSVKADNGDADSLAGYTLSSSDRLIENIIRAVGIPNGSPIIRANP